MRFHLRWWNSAQQAGSPAGNARASADPCAGGASADRRPRRQPDRRVGAARERVVSTLLQQKLDEEGYSFEVLNAGVSGDTAGGLRRLDWALEGDVRILLVALGANDGLRGLSVAEMKQNLTTIIERARAKNVVVILAGMEAPPNYGPKQCSRSGRRSVTWRPRSVCC